MPPPPPLAGLLAASILLFVTYISWFGEDGSYGELRAASVRNQKQGVQLEQAFVKLPTGWKPLRRPRSDSRIGLVLMVKQSNLDILEQTLLNVSDPTHPQWGQHLTHEEVEHLVRPSQQAVEAVETWLRSHNHARKEVESGRESGSSAGSGEGASDVKLSSPLGFTWVSSDIVRAVMSIAEAEALLEAEYWEYIHTPTGQIAVRVNPQEGYTLPARVARHLDFVGPTLRFPPTRANKNQPSNEGAGEEETQIRGESGVGARRLGEGRKQQRAQQEEQQDDDQFNRNTAQGGFTNVNYNTQGDSGGDGGGPPPPDGAAAGDQTCFTPASIRRLYSMGTEEATGTPRVARKLCRGRPFFGQAVISFLEEHPDVRADESSDLQRFFAEYYPVGQGRVPTVRKMHDSYGDHTTASVTNPAKSTVEASLDIQYLMSIGGNVPTELWATSHHSPDPITTQDNHQRNEPFLRWLHHLAAEPCPPAVASVSYADNEDSVSQSYANRVSAEFQKAGVRGISILVASGDDGVGGAWSEQCPNGQYVATFPASSPWVTAVGGTITQQQQENQGVGGEEMGASLSAGGFSYKFKRPSYQNDAVKAYMPHISNMVMSSMPSSSTGRGYPDISAVCTQYSMICGGQTSALSGTSAATPTVSGVVSLVNHARMAQGKRAMGFLNPFLYQQSQKQTARFAGTGSPGVFQDMTQGSNPGCSGPGFYAAKGWDAVTGVGSPNYIQLKSASLSLP